MIGSARLSDVDHCKLLKGWQAKCQRSPLESKHPTNFGKPPASTVTQSTAPSQTSAEIVKHSDFLNRLVLDEATRVELGRVEVLWMYPPMHRVFGFVSKSGFLGNKKAAFKLAQIQALATEGILVQGEPDPTDTDHVQRLETLIQAEVYSEQGNCLGRIIDYRFKLKTGKITSYLFVSNGWTGMIDGVYKLLPKQIRRLEGSQIIVSESESRDFKLHQEGLKQRLEDVEDFLLDDYDAMKDGVRREVRSLSYQAKNLASLARGRFQKLSEETKARAQTLAEQAKEKAQTLSEQVREETETFTQQSRQASDGWVEQLKTRQRQWTEKLQDGTFSLENFQAGDRSPVIDVAPMDVSRDSAEQSGTETWDDDSDWDEDWDDWELDDADEQPEPVVSRQPVTPDAANIEEAIAPPPTASTTDAPNSQPGSQANSQSESPTPSTPLPTSPPTPATPVEEEEDDPWI